jgi:hypothetical protein
MDFVVAQLENGFLKETRFLSKKPLFWTVNLLSRLIRGQVRE